MAKFLVHGKVVDVVDLLQKRSRVWRLDLIPFLGLYGLWLAAVVPSLDFGDASVVLGCISAFHILVLLFTIWSVDFKCFVQYVKVLHLWHILHYLFCQFSLDVIGDRTDNLKTDDTLDG